MVGTVDYRERELLPTPAELEVELVMVSPSGADEEILGKWYSVEPGSVPIEFEVPYALDVIDPNATYLVRARILGLAGRLWQTTRLFPVELSAEAARVRSARAIAVGGADGSRSIAGDGPDGQLDAESLDIGRVVLTKVPRREAARAQDSLPDPVADVGPLVGPLAGGHDGFASATLPDEAMEAARAAGAAEALAAVTPGAAERETVLVTGRLFRQPDVLPRGCLLSVRLIEVPEDGSAEVVVADELFEDPEPGPVVFEITVDLGVVDLARPHSIRADLVDPDGKTLFQTTSLFSVPLSKAGETVDVGRVLLVKVPR